MSDELYQIKQAVLERIKPPNQERAKIQSIASDLERKVAKSCKKFGVDAIIRVEGSLAKDTWLLGDPDVDVFMRLPTDIPRKELGDISLKIAKEATAGHKQVERFAEHPYLEAFIDGVRVNIVPCYNTKPGQWQSATDRTPYHTDYINRNLSRDLHDEVRLLKKFMNGINVYGAEIKVGGFSGYLCELLTLKYGSFEGVLKEFSHQTQKRIVDLEGYYEKNMREAECLFPEPLVIIDPVDPARNVASAVQSERLYEFVGASRAFLKFPDERFFFPPELQRLTVDALEHSLTKRGSDLIFLLIENIDAVPDVLWGQLFKSKRAIRRMLDLQGFKILRDSVWSSDGETSVFIFELEQQIISGSRIHLGPPLEKKVECENFLSKYLNNNDAISGPFINDGRWKVMLPRKFYNALELLQTHLESGGKNIGVADLVSDSIRSSFKVLSGKSISNFYNSNNDFALFLTEFLDGKPFWLNMHFK